MANDRRPPTFWLIGPIGLGRGLFFLEALNLCRAFPEKSRGRSDDGLGRGFPNDKQQRRHGNHAVEPIHDRYEVPLCRNFRADQSGQKRERRQ